MYIYIYIYFSSQVHIDECGYTVIKCVYSQCNTEIKRDLLAKHLEEECLYRSVQCTNCQETLSFATLKVKYLNKSI